MTAGLKLYLLGLVFALAWLVLIMRDKDGRIAVGEFILCLIFSVLSWLTLLALVLGHSVIRKDN